MANISKHYTEKHGKTCDCEDSRIDFTVARNSIGVDDQLIGIHHVVSQNAGWRLEFLFKWLHVELVDKLWVEMIDLSLESDLRADRRPELGPEVGIFEHKVAVDVENTEFSQNGFVQSLKETRVIFWFDSAKCIRYLFNLIHRLMVDCLRVVKSLL